jgi:hypothetical protein
MTHEEQELVVAWTQLMTAQTALERAHEAAKAAVEVDYQFLAGLERAVGHVNNLLRARAEKRVREHGARDNA